MTTKSKTNALDALRALIAERQQYDQWVSTLESKRDGTPEHVFNRVYSDYRSRLDRVLGEIRSHSEELQLSITALSAKLGEVAKEEEAKRDSIQEAELRAAVGEYDVAQWEAMRADAARQLEKIGADRGSLESQLAELESIRKLSEVTSGSDSVSATVPAASSPAPTQSPAASPPAPVESAASASPAPSQPVAESLPAQTPDREAESRSERDSASERPRFSDVGWPARDIVDVPATPAPVPAQPGEQAPTPARGRPATPSSSLPVTAEARVPSSGAMDPSVVAPRPSASPSAPPPAPTPPAKRRTPTGKDAQISSGFSKPVPTPPEGRPEVNKTLKCPECGTPNYPTEWYCERCGGELATM